MAIVIEEEKGNGIDYVRWLGWLLVIGVLAGALYYFFFASPELVPVAPPDDFQYIAPISQISVHPQDLLSSPAFQALKSPSFAVPTAQGPGAVGRTNPFLAVP